MILCIPADVHHGNGTQEIFEEDPRVLFISVHQAGNYPLFSGIGRLLLMAVLLASIETIG